MDDAALLGIGNADSTITGLSQPTTPKAEERGMTFSRLMRKHPSYNAPYWRRLRALYSGGRKLLGDPELMREIFPLHRNELPIIYMERCSRAFYASHPARLIGKLMAQLGATPVVVAPAAEPGSTEEPKPAPQEWADFFADCSKPGGKKVPLRKLLLQQLREALIVQTAWTLVDMPRSDEILKRSGKEAFYSQLEKEKAGAERVYACAIPAEQVLDWEENDAGELLMAIVFTEERPRLGLDSARENIIKTWTYYDRRGWQLYELVHTDANPPNADTVVKLKDEGNHLFKDHVPLVRIQLEEDLWAMNKLEGLAREWFNKRNALAWAEFQSLLPELYEFLAADKAGGVVIGGGPAAPGRAKDQRRGQGFVQERQNEDRAEFIGPDAGPFAQSSTSCKELETSMDGQMNEMAQNAPQSAEVLGRSGESKSFDRVAQAILAMAFGEVVREHAIDVIDLACTARAPELVDKWQATGADKFDQKGAADIIAEAVELVAVPVPSPTFKRRYLLELAKTVLGPGTTVADIEKIKQELEDNIPEEGAGAVEETGDDEQEKARMLREGVRDPAEEHERQKDLIAAKSSAGGKVSYSSKKGGVK